jgi:glycyl-tRNA synthetase
MENKMEKIVSLAKRRGFVFPNSEIYGGLASAYDYGHLGVELKNNIKKLWWKYFIQDRDDMVGIDGNIISNPKIWEASGHVQNFKDPMFECKKCHTRFRADKEGKNFTIRVGGAEVYDNKVVSPVKYFISGKCDNCGISFDNKENRTEIKNFSNLFKTKLGAIEDESIEAYLRGETAQNIFVNFKNILDSSNMKIPFGIGQIGKAFRNEITTGNFIFRTFEFEQMEIEYFISPKEDWNKIFEEFLKKMNDFAEIIGLNKKDIFNVEISEKERAFYSKRTIDIEFNFPFGQEELWGLAYRTDYDLSRHQEFSKENLEYFDQETKEKYIPHVIEPSFGLDRTLLAILSSCYTEEETEKEKRIVLKLKPSLAPYKIAVAPLLGNKPELSKKAKEIFNNLKKKWHCFYDDRGNIGKRYRYQDEIGTPYFIVFDFDSLKNKDVSVRDRDTMKQERIKISELEKYFDDKLGC